MDVREKLVKLVEYMDGVCPSSVSCYNCPHKDIGEGCSIQSKVDYLIKGGVTVQEWISVDERIPQNFVSVLGYMTDAGEFPPVRECYTVGNEFFFPALCDVHPVSHWCELPQPPKGE